MTTIQFLECFICGILGMLFYIFVVKLPALKKRSTVANLIFNPKDFFKEEWIALGASIVALLISLMVIDELVKYKPIVADFVKWLFVFVGYTGSSSLQALLGRTDHAINKIVDTKTNIADNVTNDKP